MMYPHSPLYTRLSIKLSYWCVYVVVVIVVVIFFCGEIIDNELMSRDRWDKRINGSGKPRHRSVM